MYFFFPYVYIISSLVSHGEYDEYDEYDHEAYEAYDSLEPYNPERFGSGKSFESTLGTVLLQRPGILVVNKPSGTSSEDFVNLMEVALAAPLFAVSRLDHPTSGVLPLAVGKDRIFQWLKAQFAGHLVVKKYLCLCQGPALGPVGHSTSGPASTAGSDSRADPGVQLGKGGIDRLHGAGQIC